jgi:hypothetical protein
MLVTIHCRKASPPPWYCCSNCMNISMCTHLCSPVGSFCTHPAQILWYPSLHGWQNLHITGDVQLVSYVSNGNLSVLSNQSRALTCSTLPTICEVVIQPKWSSSTMRVLPLWNLSTHWYTFLCTIQFYQYCANILLWISEGFTLSDHKNQIKNTAQQWCNPDMEPTHLHWLPHNIPRFSSVCSIRDVCKSTTEKLPGFYMPTALTFWSPFIFGLQTSSFQLVVWLKSLLKVMNDLI